MKRFNRIIRLFAVFLVTSLYSIIHVAQAKAYQPTYRYYDVVGKDFKGLSASIKANRPSGYNSMNEWHISWQYQFEHKKDGCHISQPKVTKEVFVTLPRWQDQSQATNTLRQGWQRYQKALIIHQMGHVEYAHKAQQAILIALEHMPPSKDCKTLKKKANAMAKFILADFDKQDKAYEKRTGGRRTQGAVFQEAR